jgi:hypothetical protein
MISDENELTLDFDDEVIGGACIMKDGEIVHEAAKGAAMIASRAMVEME